MVTPVPPRVDRLAPYQIYIDERVQQSLMDGDMERVKFLAASVDKLRASVEDKFPDLFPEVTTTTTAITTAATATTTNNNDSNSTTI